MVVSEGIASHVRMLYVCRLPHATDGVNTKKMGAPPRAKKMEGCLLKDQQAVNRMVTPCLYDVAYRMAAVLCGSQEPNFKRKYVV
jgi:hypothetical protein